MPFSISILQKLLESEDSPLECPLCHTKMHFQQLPDIDLIQDQLMSAIETLSLLVEAGEDKKIRIASKLLDTDDIAVNVLYLVCLVKHLNNI